MTAERSTTKGAPVNVSDCPRAQMPATCHWRSMQRWTGIAVWALLSLSSMRARASDDEAHTGRVAAEAGLGLVSGTLGFGLGFLAAGELVQSGANGGCIDA